MGGEVAGEERWRKVAYLHMAELSSEKGEGGGIPFLEQEGG